MNAMSSRVRAPFDHPIDYFIAITVPSFDEGREAIRECHQHVTGSERGGSGDGGHSAVSKHGAPP